MEASGRTRDDGPMTDTRQTSSHSGRPPTSRRLIRPHDSNLIAGVAVGLARNLDIPTWVVRLAFVVLAAAGGLGFVLYVAGWLLIPREGEPRSVGSSWITNVESRRSWGSVILVAIAAMIVVGSTGLIEPDLAFAAILGVIGVLLYRGQIGSRRRSEGEPGAASEVETGAPASARDDAGGESSTSPMLAETPAPSERRRPRSSLGRWTLGLTLIGLGIMGVVDVVSGRVDLSIRHYLGAAFVGLGAGLVLGAWVGRARGLVFLGILLIPALVASPLGDVDFDDLNVRLAPETLDDLPTTISFEAGQAIIDLRNLDLDGATTTLDAELGVGELVVIVPPDVAVDATAAARVGQAIALNSESAGLGRPTATSATTGSNGSLTILAEVGIGRAEISRDAARSDTRTDLVVDSPFELEERYQTDVGSIRLDFSQLVLEEPRDVEISVELGSVSVVLPEDTDTRVEASVEVGSIDTPSGRENGPDIQTTYSSGPEPLLTLNIGVDAGEITIEEARQ